MPAERGIDGLGLPRIQSQPIIGFRERLYTPSASAMQVANVSKPFLRNRFGGLLGSGELGFEEFCIEMTSI